MAGDAAACGDPVRDHMTGSVMPPETAYATPVGAFLSFLGLIGMGVAIAGLIRGRIRWARIGNRRIAGFVLLGGFLVAAAGGALSPTPARTTADSSPTSEATPSPTRAAPAPEILPSPSPTSASVPSPAPIPTPKPTPKPVSRILYVGGVALPNRALTPGSVFAAATTSRICVTGYSSTVRSVSDSLRASVYARYGIAFPPASGTYEADHLIPLELGGDNTVANLWPEPQQGGAGFPRKDVLENHLHALVCSGQLALRTAQLAIAINWVTASHRYSTVPAVAPVAPAPAAGRTANPGRRLLRELHRRPGRRCGDAPHRRSGIPVGS